jgi:hypothetical protein
VDFNDVVVMRFWKALPLRVKILVGVLAFALLWGLGAWLDSRDSWPTSAGAGSSEDDAARVEWRKELTDGARAFYGEDWKPSKSDRRTIDAMAGEAAKTYEAPKQDRDE